MIDRSNKHKIFLIAILTGIVLVFDFFTIITNLYVVPVLEGFGLPDILIYMKTGIFLVIWIFLTVWLASDQAQLNKTNIKILMVVGIATIVAYFLSLYVYKYYLLIDTSDILLHNILEGNPALYLDFSRINYKTLQYIIAVYGGFNSELILFAEAMFFQIGVQAIQKMETQAEPVHVYDDFMFDVKLFPHMVLYVLAAFLSINILLMRFDLLGSIEMAIAITGFMVVVPGLTHSFRIYRNRNNECTRSFFIGTYKYIYVSAILGIVLFAALFGLNLYFVQLGRATYRIVSSLAALILAILIFYRVKKRLALENK